MARKKRKRKNEENGREEEYLPWHADLSPETKKSIFAVFAFIFAALFILSYIGQGGRVGGSLFGAFDFLLGKGYFVAPLAFIFIGFSLLSSERPRIVGSTIFGGALFLLSTLTLFHILFEPGTGGFLGRVAGGPLISLFDFWASMVITGGIFIVSLLLTFNMPIWHRREVDEEETEEEPVQQPEGPGAAEGVKAAIDTINTKLQEAFERRREEPPQPAAAAASVSVAAADDIQLAVRRAAKKFAYKKPPLELLADDKGKPSSGDIKANSNIIKRTLENFGITVDMDEVAVGPTVTQYTLKPAEGVKLSRIVALHNDLSLALAAHPIRIEAPIPGKSLVGIEVPNRSIALVGLRALLENSLFQEAGAPLLFALGRDVAGMPVFADLAKMPHLLISGATGAGKSVCMHSLISSFLYRNPPEMLRFIIVDPKRVELSVYNDIPHLLTPVITDAKTTIQALRWAVKEMDRRYDMLSSSHSRDLVSYNAKAAKEGGKDILPYIVVVIDELADLMMSFPREVESSIVRLAQMARAVGIHLIVATQRPSVEVITGLIKANITSRIAFQVASQIDSRTILDTAGAEKLLGNGDMLFISGDLAKPRRIQGSFVSEPEVKRVVDFLREEAAEPEYDDSILATKLDADVNGAGDMADDDDDPLYEEAKGIVLEAGKASASYLQRRLRVGYARAARLLDILEGRGVIGPADGAKPREVLMGRDGTPDETTLA